MSLLAGRFPAASDQQPPAAESLRTGTVGATSDGRNPGLVFVAGCMFVVNLLSFAPHQPVLLGACGLLVLIGSLGYATYCALPGPPRDPPVCAFLSGCYGVVVLILIGLADNTFLPYLGIHAPLAHLPVLLSIDAVLLVLCWLGRERWEFLRNLSWESMRTSVGRVGWRAALVALPAAAASGAVALDNGRGAGVTLVMLIACALVFGFLLVRANRVSQTTILAAVYAIALALLLMTSLRGRYITGHDVQHEYFVFQLAHQNWRWNIADFRDPYNACLSITVLPTMLAGILHVSNEMIYKLLFQLIFALVPVGVYLLSERLAGRRPAVLAAMVFVSFPTYFSDMPMLNRQEIAMFLLTGMVLLFVDRWPGVRRTQQAPFLLLGLGVVLSHYSTSYLMIGQFGIAVLLPAAYRRVLSLNPRWRQRFGRIPQARLITVPVVVTLVVFAVIWQSPLTHTGGNFSQIASNIVKTVAGHTVSESGSSDLSASFFGGTGDPAVQARDFATASLRLRQPGIGYYPASVVTRYPLGPSPEEVSKLTPLGRELQSAGISPFSLNSTLRGGSAKVMQILLLLGLLGLLLRRPRSWGVRWDPDYLMLCIGGLGTVGAIVVLPFLSNDYGLLRAFQQTLVVLSLPVVLGCAMLGSALGKIGRDTASVALPVVFFASSTGITAAATGGYLPQLHLSNAGNNYDAYYTQDAERAIGQWLQKQLPAGRTAKNLQADAIASSQLVALGFPGAGVTDISPGLMAKNSFVFLSYANVVLDRTYAQYDGLSISYKYPMAFLDENKNRVADAGISRVYR